LISNEPLEKEIHPGRFLLDASTVVEPTREFWPILGKLS
jgi:hypothetical protein